MLCFLSRAALAVMVANEGTKLMTKRKIRSISTDSGVRCHLTSLKNETFKALAKKDIEDKIFQGIKLYLNYDDMTITRNYICGSCPLL